MKAGEVAEAAVCIGLSDTLGHARKLMVRHKVHRLVVVDAGRPVGVLSVKDMLPKLRGGPVSRRRPIDSMLVSRVMSAGLLTAREDSELSDVARMMVENRVSSIPITAQDGSLASLVTKEGVLRAFVGAGGKKLKVSDIMVKDVFSVGRMHTLSHVKKAFGEKGVGRLVVREKDAPVGVITATDVLFLELDDPVAGLKVRRANFFRRKGLTMKANVSVREPAVGDIMAGDPVTVLGKDDAKKAAGLMLEHGISGIPVVDQKGSLSGIITKTDLVRAFIERGAKGGI